MSDHQISEQSVRVAVPRFRFYGLSARVCIPGVSVSVIIAIFAYYTAIYVNGPAMLFALIAGMAGHYLLNDAAYAPGIKFAAQQVLRLGVALLGAKLVIFDVMALGFPVIGLVVAGVVFALLSGWVVGRIFGLTTDHSVLSAGSVAICGASAALAISSVLGQDKDSERRTTVTIIGVTTLSTIVMMLYPVVTRMMGFDDQNAGIFIGATIHDVAQVMGAGYMVSGEAGQTAAIVKLARVACLVPAVLVIGYIFCQQQQDHEACTAGLETKIKQPLLPGFLVGFVALMILNSFDIIPQAAANLMGDLSGWCLLIAVTALGLKTSFKDIKSIGFKPVLVLTVQTILLALFILTGIVFLLPALN